MKKFKDLNISLSEIKRYKSAMTAPGVDKATARELVLYITNDSQLYRGRTSAIIKNLQKKVGKATYDGTKAEKLFMYLVKDGIKKYEKDNAEPGWAKKVDKKTKDAIAQELLDYYEDEIGESVEIEDGEELAETSFLVDIEGIGQIIIDGKSSAEIKAKMVKKLKKSDDIKDIRRMPDAEKKKYFKSKAMGKGDEYNTDQPIKHVRNIQKA